jgi:hypothetical protein
MIEAPYDIYIVSKVKRAHRELDPASWLEGHIPS